MGWVCRFCGYVFSDGPRLETDVHVHVCDTHETEVSRVREVARLAVWIEPEELAEANLA
jgi:hypothetical protein